MTDRNSPGRTLNETLSTAVTGPSAVSKRTTMSSATRMASLDAARRHRATTRSSASSPRSWRRCSRARPARRRPRRRRLRPRRLPWRTSAPRSAIEATGPKPCAPCARAMRGEVDVRLGDALADPAVLDRAVAHARDALLMQFVVEEGSIIGDYDQQRNVVVRRGPQRGDAHQEIAVAANRDRQPAAAFERQRRADRNAGAAADAAAAVGAEIIERMVGTPSSRRSMTAKRG